MNRRALVTGASGFVGRHLVVALLAAGRPVTALCRRREDLADLRHPALDVAAGDLRDPACYRTRLPAAGSIFHLAGVRNHPRALAREAQEVNVDATLALAGSALAEGVARFVHVATASIYGPADGGRARTEEDALEGGCGFYVRSKAEAVRGLRRLVQAGLPAVTVCPAIAFGPDHPSHPNRITSEIRRLLAGGPRIWLAGGRQRRNLAFVDDVIQGLLAAEERGSIGEEYLLAGPEASARALGDGVLSLAARRRGLAVSLPAAPALWAAGVADRLRGLEPGGGYAQTVRTLLQEWRFSSAKAGRELGFQPRPLAEGLARTVDWLRTVRRA